MSTFAIVSHIDHLPRLLSDLAGLRQVRRLRTGHDDLMLDGIWVEHCGGVDPGPDVPLLDRLMSGPLQIVSSLEMSGIWALCRPQQPDVTRATMLGAIVEASGARARRGRFIPVYRDDEPLHHHQAEWAALAARQPGIVWQPMQQSVGGAITFTEFVHAGGHSCQDDGPRHRQEGRRRPSVVAFPRRPCGHREPAERRDP